MDFGLAQLSGGTKITKTETVLGTPAYMSPEQAQRLETNRRTDIWSLGVVLYEMVTGRLPFEGERESAVLHSIIHEPHEPITAFHAGVPLECAVGIGPYRRKGAGKEFGAPLPAPGRHAGGPAGAARESERYADNRIPSGSLAAPLALGSPRSPC
jgi:serine/threonine protein kinase